MSACVTFDNLTLGYNSHPAVHHLNGIVRKGSLTAVVGSNGSGKSTLMKGIVGVLKPMSGACGVAPGTSLAYLPQQSELDRTFPARVVDLISLGLWPRRGLLGRYRPEDRLAVSTALSAVGLEGFAKRSIDTLSGGQLQRALFARVLVQDADLILLDEPFNAIDARTMTDLIGLIKRWHGEKRTILVVVHDLELVRQHFPEALLLARRPVANGLQFEGFLQRLVEASGTKAPVVELTKGGEVLKNAQDEPHHGDEEGKKAEEGHDHEAEEAVGGGRDHAHKGGHHHHGEFDPHAWQSVHNAEVYVNNIAEAFCAADAAGCDTYKANAEAYGEKLEALEAEIRAAVAEISEDRRTVITSHDAFGYFQHEYDIKFLAPEGVSTESEASAADVVALIKQVKEDKASAIFLENITNPRLIEQIASETGIKVGGTLYSDALSDESGPAATYIDMMTHNVNTIKGAILGS